MRYRQAERAGHDGQRDADEQGSEPHRSAGGRLGKPNDERPFLGGRWGFSGEQTVNPPV